jgi:hypothetical protein
MVDGAPTRRRFLAGAGRGVAAAAALGGAAGCLGRLAGGCDTGAAGGPRSTDHPDRLPVPRDEMVRAAARDEIAAISDPVFGRDWTGVEMESEWWGTGETFSVRPELNPADEVIGVVRDGEARAYPLSVLRWHEVVNDDFGGPLLVSYCPLCASGVVADRLVGGEPAMFGVSGLLYRWNLVLYDRGTGSLWSQLLATAISGPRTGDDLSLSPSEITSWGTWRERHPETTVLRPPPESGTVDGSGARPYPRNPYAGYDASREVGVPDGAIGSTGTGSETARRAKGPGGDLHPKTQVLGLTAGDEAVAYPLGAVADAGVVNDRVGDLPVAVTLSRSPGTRSAVGEASGDEGATGEGSNPPDADGTARLVAYDRRVDGEARRFETPEPGVLAAAGTTWDAATGAGRSGPLAGRPLRRVPGARTMFWFAWRDFHPETRVYDGGGPFDWLTGACRR